MALIYTQNVLIFGGIVLRRLNTSSCIKNAGGFFLSCVILQVEMFVCCFTVGWCSRESMRASNPSHVTQFGSQHYCQRFPYTGWQILRDYSTPHWGNLTHAWACWSKHDTILLVAIVLYWRGSIAPIGTMKVKQKRGERKRERSRINAVFVWITEILLICLFLLNKISF